jgi:WD40 repeat protein
MTASLPQDFCPYKGLQPYTETDRAFFFGRERDTEIIASNLYASPLTVLYGESGVGKSSVLLAGVVPLLTQTPNVAVVVFRQWQDAKFASMLKSEILAAVKETSGKEPQVDMALPLDEFLLACNRILRGPVFFIFDQFEEFFLYQAPVAGDQSFDAEWARAVNRQDVDANFLVSLREDSLSRLDRFRGRIPKLLTNMLRLKHLDCKAGADAIRKPLDKYNELLSDGVTKVSVEDELVTLLLEEIQAGRVTLGAARGKVNHGSEHDSKEERIETPFLQMVLTRLWNEERAQGSLVLRLETLNHLGGAERIIRTHLDKVMEKLSDAERDVAGRLFRYLVTPSGSKIAHTTTDLVSYVEMPREEVEPVLKMLSAPDVRILRPIAPPPDEPEQFRYEIFHDVLAASVLDWRRRLTEQQAKEQVRREEQKRLQRQQEEAEQARQLKSAHRMRIGITILSILLLVTIASLGGVAYQWRELKRAEKDSRSRELAADSRGELDEDPRLSLLLAVEAARISPTAEARGALHDALDKFYLNLELKGHDGPVRDAVYSPDGRFIVTGGWDNTVRVWDAQTGKALKVLRDHTDHVLGVAYSRDGRYIVSSGSDKTVRVWDVTNWQATTLTSDNLKAGAYHVDISPDSRFIAVASDVRIVIFDRQSAKPSENPRVIRVDKPMHAYCVQFSPDGNYLVATGGANMVRVWKMKTESGQPELEQTLNEGHTGSIRNAAFSPDSQYLVTASEGGAQVLQNDAQPNANANTNQPANPHDAQSAKSDDTDEDWTARIFYWKTGALLFTFSDHTGPLYDAAFSPDGHFVVSTSRDKTARVWDAKDGRDIAVLLGHTGAIYAAVFDPVDGQFLVTASEDKTARVWQLHEDHIPDLPLKSLIAMAEERIERLGLKLTTNEENEFIKKVKAYVPKKAQK